MDNTLYSPSELIDLVLDGEIAHSQSTPLFTTLATDNDLQAEFHQALAIRRAMNSEMQNSIPSVEFTNSLFQSAGVGISTGTIATFLGKTIVQWARLVSLACVSFGIGAIATFTFSTSSTTPTAQNNNQISVIELPKLYSIAIVPENTSTVNTLNKPSSRKKGLSNNYSTKILSPNSTNQYPSEK
jgi:hypothetical protein